MLYNESSDIWQMGLIFYELLTLNPLFTTKTEARLLKEVQEIDLEHEIDEINQGFNPLKNLLRVMLTVDPVARQSIDFIINFLNRVDAKLVLSKE